MHSGLILISLVVICTLSAPAVFACDGYSINEVQFNPCEGFNNTIVVTNYNLELTKDCFLIAHGCMEFRKDINSFDLTYNVTKSGITLRNGKIRDGCKQLEIIGPLLNNPDLPKKCPIKATKICGGPEKAVPIQKFKGRLAALVGKTSGKLIVNADSGDSCFKFSSTLRYSASVASRARRPTTGK